MTRLSSYPFAKSLLALSLSAVFSSAAFASAQRVEFTDHYSVKINGEVQTTPNSADTNPLQTENQWWSTTDIRGNEIKFSAVREEGKLAFVSEDVIGGFSSLGFVRNNKVVAKVEEGALGLSGNIIGGAAYSDENVSVEDNVVELDGVVLGYIPEDEELKFRRMPVIMGGVATTTASTESDSQLNVSATGNEVSIKNSQIEAALVAGGMSQGNRKTNAQANQNQVIFENVEHIGDDGYLYVIGGAADNALQAQANNNEVQLTSSDVNIVVGGVARGGQAQANGNILDLTSVSAEIVIGAMANSSEKEDDLGAQAIGNQLTWMNDNEEEVSLGQFTVASATAYTGSTVVSGNQASIFGLKTKAFEDSNVVGFLSESKDADASLTENQLKIANSQFLSSVKVGVGSGNNVVLSGNHLNIINSQFADLSGYEASSFASAKVVDNSIVANQLTANTFVGLSVGSRNSEIAGNSIFIDNSFVGNVTGIDVDSGYHRSVGDEVMQVTDNHIVFSALSIPDVSINSRATVNGYFLKINNPTVALVSNNDFEVIETNGRNITGIELSLLGSEESIDIQNNLLSLKDSKVKDIVGIKVLGLDGSNDNALKLTNNIVSLENVTASGVWATKLDNSNLRVQGTGLDIGHIILRGENTVDAIEGFESLQFDLATATAAPMLTVGSLVLNDKTIVINSAGATSPSNELQLVAGDVTMNNVTVQTAGTFATKSMVIESNTTQDALMLGNFYGELMAQESVLNDSTLTLSDSQLATVALTRQTSEEALNLLQSTENLSADAPMKGFASLLGSSNFYELGTGFDLNGTSLTVGGALRINDKWSGVGFANFSDANADSTVSGFRGDSDMKTYSAGVALRYQTEMPFYTEGALVIGQADTEFVGSYTNDTARYDLKRFYTTAQLGVGNDFALSDNVNLNVYGRYSFTYLDGDKVSLNNAYNDTFDVDDTIVHAMRVGARVKGSVAPNVQWFAGAAFERVLDGDVESMVKDAKLKTETLKGNVGIFEVGATLAPNDLGPWTMDVKAGAYAGDRRGVSGSVSLNYVF